MGSLWARRRVVVTGGAGFLGSYVVDGLRSRGCRDLVIPRSREYDLREHEAVVRLYRDSRPDTVVHLAAVVGGIGANQRRPGEFFYDNAIMGLHMIEEARRFGVEKFICVGTACAYPKNATIPFTEDELWNGYPEETNAPYGVAKKMLLVQLQAYRQQYGFKGIYLIPENLYGPRDNFDLETSHVIPAVIRKCVEAKVRGEPVVTVWGSGAVTREFLYVEDAAEGIVLAAERYGEAAPVNLGANEEITVRELVTLIAEVVGYQGRIDWDASRPDGQRRRRVDAGRAKRAFGWEPRMDLRAGLQRTIDWYVRERARVTMTASV